MNLQANLTILMGKIMSNTAYFTAAVTPSDSVDLPIGKASALYIGVGGDVAIYSPGQATSVVHKNVSSGSVLMVEARRVGVTGTTATDIVAWYA
jgi:hypothetical protein